MQDSGPQQVKKAIKAVEHSAQQLIAQAECVQISTTGWERRSHRTSLLEYARDYARAVNALTRVRRTSPKPSTK